MPKTSGLRYLIGIIVATVYLVIFIVIVNYYVVDFLFVMPRGNIKVENY